jgi:hypothetical protein
MSITVNKVSSDDPRVDSTVNPDTYNGVQNAAHMAVEAMKLSDFRTGSSLQSD